MKKILLFAMLIWVASCRPQKPGNFITVSIIPQKYFVEKIVKDRFTVNVMIPKGASPASYEPSPGQMSRLSGSELYIRIGYIPFEKVWMKKIKEVNKKMKVINSYEGVSFLEGDYHRRKEYNKSDENEKHSGHDGDDDNSKAYDPHIWLSPEAVKIQAGHIYKAVCDINPDNKGFYKKNYQAFLLEIDELNADIQSKLKNLPNKDFMIYHPSLSYFARDFGLNQIAIETGGKKPGPRHLRHIIDKAKAQDIKVIFVQEEFDITSARGIAESIGGEVVSVNPLAENWSENLRFIAKTFVEILPK